MVDSSRPLPMCQVCRRDDLQIRSDGCTCFVGFPVVTHDGRMSITNRYGLIDYWYLGASPDFDILLDPSDG